MANRICLFRVSHRTDTQHGYDLFMRPTFVNGLIKGKAVRWIIQCITIKYFYNLFIYPALSNPRRNEDLFFRLSSRVFETSLGRI